MEAWNALWSWLMTPVGVPVAWVTVLAVGAGAALAVFPATWRLTRLFATYVHEAGHAVVAVMTGRRVTRIRLEADTSGTTEHLGHPGLGRLLTAFAGYPSPALVGWGILAAVGVGHPAWALAGFAVIVVGLLFVQRSWRGLMVTVLLGGGLYLLAQFNGWWGALLLAGLAGYLLAASPRTVVELHFARLHHRRSGGEVHSDADALAAQTGIPAGVWEFLFLAACAGCVWGGLSALFS